MLEPPQLRRLRLCLQIPEPPQLLHELLMRLCSQMLEPPQLLHELLLRLCSQMLEPTQLLHLRLSHMLESPQLLMSFIGDCARRF
jgi:hypothetical protein